jgi:hypothetical protein
MLQKTKYKFKITDYQIDNQTSKIILNSPTGRFFYDPWEIKPEYKNTVWNELLNSLPSPIGEARIITLKPGTTYCAHADIDDRWHLNLQGEESYLIDLMDKNMFFLEPDGHWYSMDAGKIHVATNFGSIDRHQVVVRKLLIETANTSLISVSIKPKYDQFNFRYKFDMEISPWLNEVNKKGLMKEFTPEGEGVKFLVDRSALTNLKLSDNFKIVIE